MQFGELFTMKAVPFAMELASIVLTPLIVWFSLPPCVLVIIEFSRKLTVHDGLGYVCTVALPCLTSNDTATSRFIMLSVLLPLADSHLYVYMRSLVCRQKYWTRSRCQMTERWKYLSCLSKQCTQNGFRQI